MATFRPREGHYPNRHVLYPDFKKREATPNAEAIRRVWEHGFIERIS